MPYEWLSFRMLFLIELPRLRLEDDSPSRLIPYTPPVNSLLMMEMYWPLLPAVTGDVNELVMAIHAELFVDSKPISILQSIMSICCDPFRINMPILLLDGLVFVILKFFNETLLAALKPIMKVELVSRIVLPLP